MNLSLNELLLHGMALPLADAQSLLDIARGLSAAARAGDTPQPMLQGKHLALYGAAPVKQGGQELADAACSLGARISRLPPDPLLLRGDFAAAAAALRLVERLYDAVAFDALDVATAARVQVATELQVYGPLPPFEVLLARLPQPATLPERVHLIRALLLLTMLR